MYMRINLKWYEFENGSTVHRSFNLPSKFEDLKMEITRITGISPEEQALGNAMESRPLTRISFLRLRAGDTLLVTRKIPPMKTREELETDFYASLRNRFRQLDNVSASDVEQIPDAILKMFMDLEKRVYRVERKIKALQSKNES